MGRETGIDLTTTSGNNRVVTKIPFVRVREKTRVKTVREERRREGLRRKVERGVLGEVVSGVPGSFPSLHHPTSKRPSFI